MVGAAVVTGEIRDQKSRRHVTRHHGRLAMADSTTQGGGAKRWHSTAETKGRVSRAVDKPGAHDPNHASLCSTALCACVLLRRANQCQETAPL